MGVFLVLQSWERDHVHIIETVTHKYKSTWLLRSTRWITCNSVESTDKRLLQLIDRRDFGMSSCTFFFCYLSEKIWELKVLDR